MSPSADDVVTVPITVFADCGAIFLPEGVIVRVGATLAATRTFIILLLCLGGVF